MADINKRKRDDNDDGKTVGSGVGVVPGDTIASALDPFGTAAGAVADNKTERDTDDDNHGSKTRD
ncbi:hypothetical protein QGM71_19985 [Virgibacillus sp. C22-A2]|uniref:Uncharacterized protein n=1 Tax=Virgibacillus tibetensis TaxID=3042313 RepID=A0ABU6KKN8_9BACI|nr:hypothetical protein [Virgibacillus sp. C22-A2]